MSSNLKSLKLNFVFFEYITQISSFIFPYSIFYVQIHQKSISNIIQGIEQLNPMQVEAQLAIATGNEIILL